MAATDLAAPRVVLLDIEGTTTPITFVYDVLFPYARRRLTPFLERYWSDAAVVEARARLAEELAAEHQPLGFEVTTPAGVAAYAAWLMDRDRKSTGLKALQGLIWRDGYLEGTLTGEVFPDVAPALTRWHRAGIACAIYSSGSVLAQRLLFSSTAAGDLTPMFSGYFDTGVGPKTASTSYARIAAALDIEPSGILFLSDAPAELVAAAAAGCRVAMTLRPGNAVTPPPPGVACIHSFDELAWPA